MSRIAGPVLPRAASFVNRQVQQRVVPRVTNLVNRAAVKSAGPQYSHWVQDLGEDTRKRGWFQGVQDLSNPILMNPKIAPYAEPIVSGARMAGFAALHPKQFQEEYQAGKGEPMDKMYAPSFALADIISRARLAGQPIPNKVRFRDIVREIPQAASRVIGPELLKNITTRPAARALGSAYLSITKPKEMPEFTPTSKFERELFGTNQKVVPIGKYAKQETGISFGKAAPYVGVGLAAADIFGINPLSGGGKKAVSQIAKLKNADEISKVLKGTKIAEEYIPRIAQKLVKATDEVKIGKVIAEAEKIVPKIEQVGKNLIRERGLITTVKESAKTAPEVKSAVEGLYQVRNTQELGQKAKNLVKNFPETAQQIIDAGKTDDITVSTAIELMDKYAKEGNHTLAAKIANDLAPRLTEAGRANQAVSLYNRLTPEGIVRFAAGEINRANQANPKLGLVLKAEDAARLREMALKVQKIIDPEQRAIATAKMTDEIARLVPTPTINKVVGLWKAGLLTGLKTTGVNITSNITHGATEVIKDIPAVAVDSIASLFTGKRTKTLTLKGTGGGLKEGIEKGWRYLRTGYDERNIAAKFDYKKVNFGNSKFAKVLQTYEDGIFRLMGAEDQPFYYGAKSRSLYDQAFAQAKNKGLKGDKATKFVENLVKNPNDKMLQNAVNDGETAVFQNQTSLGKLAQGLGKSAVGEVIAPFRRTPTSVAMEVLNYSPVGIVKAIGENIGKGRFDQRAFSQLMGKGIVGTGLLYVGYKLAQKGIMALGFPQTEAERNQWELEGKQPNSIKIGDRWYQAGSFGPIGMTLLVGGYYQKGLEETGSKTQALASAIAGAGKTVVDQTFLQGISGMINALQDPTRYAGGYIGRTVGSVVPTIAADVARATDKFERSTKGNVLQPLQSRIIGLRQKLTPKRDVLGQEIETPGFVRTMADWTRSTKAKTSPVIEQLGEAGATPTKFKDKLRILKQDVQLNEKELDQLNASTGGQIDKALGGIVNTSGFKNLDKDDKAKIIDKVVESVKESQKNSLATGGKIDTRGLDRKTQIEVEKINFENSDANFKNLGDVVLRKNADGSVKSQSKLSYDGDVMEAKKTSLKKNGNFKGWLENADALFNNYQEQLQDSSLDELEKIKIQNSIDSLVAEAQKYQGYGGFTKPKKGKKVKKAKKIKLAVKTAGRYKTSQLKPQAIKISVGRIPQAPVGRPTRLRVKKMV